MFQRLALGEIAALGVTGLSLLVVEHPLGGEAPEGVSRRIAQAVEQIAAKLIAWLTLDPGERERARAALAAEAARRYSWESVAEGVIAAAQGRLDALPHPAPPADNVPAP